MYWQKLSIFRQYTFKFPILYVLKDSLTAHNLCTLKYFWKNSIEFRSPHIYASFGTFFVQIGHSIEVLCVFKHWEEFEIGDIFLQKRRFVFVLAFFKGSKARCDSHNWPIWTQKVSKEAWRCWLYINFFDRYCVPHELLAIKVSFVHTYFVLKGFNYRMWCQL